MAQLTAKHLASLTITSVRMIYTHFEREARKAESRVPMDRTRLTTDELNSATYAAECRVIVNHCLEEGDGMNGRRCRLTLPGWAGVIGTVQDECGPWFNVAVPTSSGGTLRLALKASEFDLIA